MDSISVILHNHVFEMITPLMNQNLLTTLIQGHSRIMYTKQECTSSCSFLQETFQFFYITIFKKMVMPLVAKFLTNQNLFKFNSLCLWNIIELWPVVSAICSKSVEGHMTMDSEWSKYILKWANKLLIDLTHITTIL